MIIIVVIIWSGDILIRWRKKYLFNNL